MTSNLTIAETLRQRGASEALIKKGMPLIEFLEKNFQGYEPDFCTMNGEHQVSISAKERSCFAEQSGFPVEMCLMRVHKKEFTIGMQEDKEFEVLSTRFKGSHCCFNPRTILFPSENDLKAMEQWFKEGE